MRFIGKQRFILRLRKIHNRLVTGITASTYPIGDIHIRLHACGLIKTGQPRFQHLCIIYPTLSGKNTEISPCVMKIDQARA